MREGEVLIYQCGKNKNPHQKPWKPWRKLVMINFHQLMTMQIHANLHHLMMDLQGANL